MYQNYGNASKGYSQSSSHCGKECCPKARPITKKYRFCQWYDCCVTCRPVKAPIYKETGYEKNDKCDKKGQEAYGFEKESEYDFDDYEWESGYDENDLY